MRTLEFESIWLEVWVAHVPYQQLEYEVEAELWGILLPPVDSCQN